MLRRRRLADADRARIEAAIADLEARSAAELVVVVAPCSANYAAYPALWAAGLALAAGWLAVMIDPFISGGLLTMIQGAVLAGAAAALYLTPLGILLVPPAFKRLQAQRAARLEFAALVNERTRGKDGVLLFLSLAEHYIEVIADDAVVAEIPLPRWEQMVERFRAKVRRGPLSGGLLALIAECAGVLEERFPPRPGQENELPNRVKEL